MLRRVKQAIRMAVDSVVALGQKTRAGRYINSQIARSTMSSATEVTHSGLGLVFAAPNSLTRWRAGTFATKEPETLRWIESLPEGSVLWDVGANVGLYSVYAAKKRNCRVWAFEPSVFNLELLARNIWLNGLNERVCIVPIPLSDARGPQQMQMTTTEWGGALSTFGRDFGWDGKAIRKVFAFQTFGLTMDEAVERLGLPIPAYIKMDVDGLEHFILKGGPSTLASVRGVLIEVNDDFVEQATLSRKLLSLAGLVLREKSQSQMIANSQTGFAHSFNQIWVRP